jgi:hypothetical protein
MGGNGKVAQKKASGKRPRQRPAKASSTTKTAKRGTSTIPQSKDNPSQTRLEQHFPQRHRAQGGCASRASARVENQGCSAAHAASLNKMNAAKHLLEDEMVDDDEIYDDSSAGEESGSNDGDDYVGTLKTADGNDIFDEDGQQIPDPNDLEFVVPDTDRKSQQELDVAGWKSKNAKREYVHTMPDQSIPGYGRVVTASASNGISLAKVSLAREPQSTAHYKADCSLAGSKDKVVEEAYQESFNSGASIIITMPSATFEATLLRVDEVTPPGRVKVMVTLDFDGQDHDIIHSAIIERGGQVDAGIATFIVDGESVHVHSHDGSDDSSNISSAWEETEHNEESHVGSDVNPDQYDTEQDSAMASDSEPEENPHTIAHVNPAPSGPSVAE